jgi:hypothetical protein
LDPSYASRALRKQKPYRISISFDNAGPLGQVVLRVSVVDLLLAVRTDVDLHLARCFGGNTPEIL